MKSTLYSLACAAFCLAPAIAQKSAPVQPAKPATADNSKVKPSIKFYGKTFSELSAFKGKVAVSNDYFMAGQSSKSYSHKLSIVQFPNKIKASDLGKSAIVNFTKVGREVEVASDTAVGTIGFYVVALYENRMEYMILHYGPSADGKHVHVKQLVMRAALDKKEQVLGMMKKVRGRLIKELAALEFPPIVTPKPKPKSALRFIPEIVTNIHDIKKAWIINDKFAEKSGAKPLNHIPFAINFAKQKKGKVLFMTRPKVSELIRFTHATEDKKIIETIRVTTLTTPQTLPIEKRLDLAKNMIVGFSKKFFANHKEGKLGAIYKTRVGPYNAVVVLGKMTAKDGTPFYIKLVGIIPSKSSQGLLAIMLLNPGQDNPADLNQRLKDGFAQQVLHSIRFLKRKDVPKEAPKE